MNADLAFYVGLLFGMPLGAVLLIVLVAAGSDGRKQRVEHRYLDDCSKVRTARMVRAIRGAVH